MSQTFRSFGTSLPERYRGLLLRLFWVVCASVTLFMLSTGVTPCVEGELWSLVAHRHLWWGAVSL
jgi:hypothetical protein